MLGPLEEWETLWAPYDEATYAAVLAVIEPADVVLDIGAGDLRLAGRMAERARQVIAWEIQPALVNAGLQPLPSNLVAIVTDARVRPDTGRRDRSRVINAALHALRVVC